MTNETHHCFNCRWYNAVYTKKYCSFEKENAGFCGACKKVVDKHDCCDKWQYNTPVNRYGLRYRRKDIVYKSIIEALDGLKILEQILREENEENKIDPLPPQF